MPTSERPREVEADPALLASRLAYHLRREDATSPDLPRAERLAVVRDRAARIREIRRQLASLTDVTATAEPVQA